ncbi:serine/threonine protein kinase [Polytolypa hystricis UAMH7299]|uniref:Serine/threonine protein kinase n=1 Tax=Polytolypa hystricis (strain UAMH7299) TaxID=1447883 RepID=A0A2B7Y9A1_POLH7|nr:serine/threonine protein kinase [Polytolypa hystricis UAMH7299]
MPDMATIHQSSKNNDTADLGYFASTEVEDDELEENVEDWSRYYKKKTSRLFYPICVGDVLDKRYCIEHKLGHGGFATVWLAYDIQNKQNVALKILAAGEGEHEIQMHEEILQSVQDTSRLVTCLATFSLPGDNNCNHQVLVLPWRGGCLDDLRIKKMSMTARMSAAKQLLEALESLHKAGIVHRDLKDGNCFWGVVPLDDLSRRAKYQALGRPLKQVIWVEELWKPGEFVRPLAIPDDLRTDTFYLGDFGLAMKLGSSGAVIPDGRPPMQFCSPDRLHNKGPSIACDMWSYMCIFAELYLGHPIFSSFGTTHNMVGLLGPLPEEWKGDYLPPENSLDLWYDQDKKPSPSVNLHARIARARPDIDPIERDLVYSVMARGFNYSPEKRLTATQLLQDPSFKALLDRYC